MIPARSRGPRHPTRGSAPRGTALPQARTITDTEYQRLRRSGDWERGRRGEDRLVWSQPRNGLPWKPYVYRGAG